MDVEDPTPPSPPVWVEKSLPEEWPERGIDAHELSGVYLEWHYTPESTIGAYKIHRAEYFDDNDSLGNMELLVVLNEPFGIKLEYVDTKVEVGKTMYYSIVGVDGSQNSSHPSDSISYCLHLPITGHMMEPNGTSDTLSLSRKLAWQNYYLDDTEDYCLTIINEDGECLYRGVHQPLNYVGGSEMWNISEEIMFETGEKYLWRIDTGARYVDGLETNGSESIWATFVYIK